MAEPYAPAYEFDVVFDGNVIGLSTFEYSEEHELFPTDVHTDRGATSVGVGAYTCNVRFEAPVKVADEANYPDSGDRLDPCTFTSGGKVRTGQIVIGNMTERLGVRGGKVRSYTGRFSGVVTGVTAGATS